MKFALQNSLKETHKTRRAFIRRGPFNENKLKIKKKLEKNNLINYDKKRKKRH